MKATISWQQGVAFLGESGSGHQVMMDGPPEHGGENLGVRPMEMLLLGLGGCASFDVIHILKKGRQPVTDCTVEITASRKDAVPAVFETIHLAFKVAGQQLNQKRVEQAVALSVDKYCSAAVMLKSTAELTFDIAVEESA